MCVRARVCVYVRVFVCVCVRAHVCACACVCVVQITGDDVDGCVMWFFVALGAGGDFLCMCDVDVWW